jgi:hypothetical protein
MLVQRKVEIDCKNLICLTIFNANFIPECFLILIKKVGVRFQKKQNCFKFRKIKILKNLNKILFKRFSSKT